MPIQFNLPNIAADTPLKSSVPDFMSALKQGLELGYMPRHHENEEYGSELANKINEAKAKYAMQQEQATLRSKQGSLSLLPLRQQLLKAKYDAALASAQKAKYFQDMMNDYFRGQGSNPSSTQPTSNRNNVGSFAEQLLGGVERNESPTMGQGLLNTEPQEPIQTQQPQGKQLPFGINKDDFMKAMFYKMAGLTPPTNHGNTLTGSAREAESMMELRNKYGSDSRVVKEAEAKEEQNKRRQDDLSEIRNRESFGAKPGDVPIKDPNTNSIIGFRKQTTEKQKEASKNIGLFNYFYPMVVKGAAPFSGPGATYKMEEAARKYKTDPKSAKLIDDLYIADKALTNTTISEAARFQAGRTNQTYNRYAESLKADDVPAKFKRWIKEGLVPSEANLKAGIRWQQEMNKAEKKAQRSIPATYDYYFNPDQHFENQQKMQQANEPDDIEEKNVIIIDPTGKKFETTEENAKHLPKGWRHG